MRSKSSDRYVYILASDSRVLYTGSTSDLGRRIYQHKHGLLPGFTRDYQVTRLVYWERHASVMRAAQREREIKGWRRSKKIALIERQNAGWLDLAVDWYGSRRVGPSLRSG
jgi:putative endonuclease